MFVAHRGADGVEVTVRATMQTASGVLMPMDFPLVMSVAGGHWQDDRNNDAQVSHFGPRCYSGARL